MVGFAPTGMMPSVHSGGRTVFSPEGDAAIWIKTGVRNMSTRQQLRNAVKVGSVPRFPTDSDDNATTHHAD
jgi:hypothetical protein